MGPGRETALTERGTSSSFSPLAALNKCFTSLYTSLFHPPLDFSCVQFCCSFERFRVVRKYGMRRRPTFIKIMLMGFLSLSLYLVLSSSPILESVRSLSCLRHRLFDNTSIKVRLPSNSSNLYSTLCERPGICAKAMPVRTRNGSLDYTPAKFTDGERGPSFGLMFTHDDWPQFPTRPNYDIDANASLPNTSFNPPYIIQWDFNTSEFLNRPDVKGKSPKLITWMGRVRYYPSMPQPVRLRVCPEMPCRMTSERSLFNQSAALVWNIQEMTDAAPPRRENKDQVYIFHNQERQTPLLKFSQRYKKTFYRPAWKSAFNWTMTFRSDSDIQAPYGYLAERPSPLNRDYAAILSKKKKFASWLVSHCHTHARREAYVKLLQRYMKVSVYGKCGPLKCPFYKDDECFQRMSQNYKFYMAFENAICPDYITEKLFRIMESDQVVVARGGSGYENLPPGTFINTNDFKSAKDLADYLLYLDKNPEEYIKILKAKDRYQVVYEEYPHREPSGFVKYIHYHYEAVPFCEMCRRLWDLDSYRKSEPDILKWFNRGNCLEPCDI